MALKRSQAKAKGVLISEAVRVEGDTLASEVCMSLDFFINSSFWWMTSKEYK